MRRYLVRAAAKEIRAGKALFALAVAGVALGVASVLSIQLLNQGALGAFAGTVRAVSGEADVSVLGWAGTLDEALLVDVLAVPGVRAAALAAMLPLDGGGLGLGDITVAGREPPDRRRGWDADWNVVTPGYFAALAAMLPLGGGGLGLGNITVAGREAPDPRRGWDADWNVVTPGSASRARTGCGGRAC